MSSWQGAAGRKKSEVRGRKSEVRLRIVSLKMFDDFYGFNDFNDLPCASINSQSEIRNLKFTF